MTVMKAGASGGGVSGLVAVVSESGYVCLSYMGTDPPSQVVNTAKAALNYDNMDEEHRRLLQVCQYLYFCTSKTSKLSTWLASSASSRN